MASAEVLDEERNLETLLARATNPLHRVPDSSCLAEFCEFVEKEHDGPQTALRLLAHKIQSPLEKESLLALFVLEEAVKSCGSKFRTEFGKFRFLNEMIKVVSPKYLGNRASPKVKQKIIELMYVWSIELKQESKIFEAYQMLKRQGVVLEDPVYIKPNIEPLEAPPPRPKNDIFDDEENSIQLQKLLHSNRPEDLQAANRLIKNMVKEADKKMELLAKRSTELETVHNNAKVLADMLDHYNEKDTSAEEIELMKELYESCARLRPKLFRLAGEMGDKEEGLNDILKANDELTIVITRYKKIMGISLETSEGAIPIDATNNGASLLDLGSPIETPVTHASDSSLLDDQLLALGLNDPPDVGCSSVLQSSNVPTGLFLEKETRTSLNDLDHLFRIEDHHSISSKINNGFGSLASSLPLRSNSVIDSAVDSHIALPSAIGDVAALKPVTTTVASNPPPKNQGDTSSSKGMKVLDELGQSMLKQSLPAGQKGKLEFPSTPQKIPLSQMKQQKENEQATSVTSKMNPSAECQMSFSPAEGSFSPAEGSFSQSPLHEILSLTDVFVPLDNIQPGSLPSLTLLEKNGLTVVMHFGQNCPRPDVSVMVVSTMSKNSSPVKNVMFQAAVPKSMKIKLQPPSATDLPPHNPILPPAAITQVLLLANPQKEKVRLKYKVNYSINNEEHSETGEIDSLLSAR